MSSFHLVHGFLVREDSVQLVQNVGLNTGVKCELVKSVHHEVGRSIGALYQLIKWRNYEEFAY